MPPLLLLLERRRERRYPNRFRKPKVSIRTPKNGYFKKTRTIPPKNEIAKEKDFTTSEREDQLSKIPNSKNDVSLSLGKKGGREFTDNLSTCCVSRKSRTFSEDR